MPYQTIKVEICDSLCILTMDNPKSLNALSDLTFNEIEHAMEEMEKNDSVRVVIATGEGKAFIAGADISHMANQTPDEAKIFSELNARIYRKIEKSAKVYIAAINGFALGGGCEFALACDIRIASDKAKLGLPEVGLGILPGGGGTQRLPNLVGLAKAKELIFTADIIRAEEALAIGLVNHVVPAEELMEFAKNMAGRIAKNAPKAVSYAKECVQFSAESDLDTGVMYENAVFGLCFATADQKEGMAAFLEKREAKFIGK